MSCEWRDRRDPQPDEIEAMCLLLQAKWTSSERLVRIAGGESCEPRWTVPQYLVHHQQVGKWVGGRCKLVRVWRCVDGR